MLSEIEGCFYDEPKMFSADLNKIQVLSEEVSKEQWVKYVSAIDRHFMLLKEDEWPSLIVQDKNYLYHWLEDWNNDEQAVFSQILEAINVSADSLIYIFWMKEVSVKTIWGVFTANWANFLYEDEGCIVVIPESEAALVLSNGQAWIGERF